MAAIADLEGNGSKYLVVAGWYGSKNGGSSGNTSPEVKVYKLNDDGTGSDKTNEILGLNNAATVNYPLIADFNGDGVDDIFLAGFRDFPVVDSPSVLFLSNVGTKHTRIDLSDMTWSHGSVVVDVNNDGKLDVVNSNGKMWINDGSGGFAFQDNAWAPNWQHWINGMGVCSGRFNGSNTNPLLVITDQASDSQSLPVADSIIYELNGSLKPIVEHPLPVPILNVGISTEASHDVACRVADINNDGLLDVVVVSRPLPIANDDWTDQSVVQILINKGNWQFEDQTSSAMVNYDRNTAASYTPQLLDLNNDGYLDLWLPAMSAKANSNQVWLNKGNGSFKKTFVGFSEKAAASGQMYPVKFGNKYSFVFMVNTSKGYSVYLTKPTYSF